MEYYISDNSDQQITYYLAWNDLSQDISPVIQASIKDQWGQLSIPFERVFIDNLDDKTIDFLHKVFFSSN